MPNAAGEANEAQGALMPSDNNAQNENVSN